MEAIYGLKRFELFSKYKKNINVFFESGTHVGDSIQTALNLEFNKILSVEIDKNLYDRCTNRFISDISIGKVKLYLGDSASRMQEMLEEVNERAMFWLDGHVDGLNGDPVWQELEYIKDHHIKTHTIIIDDIPIYYKNDFKKLESKILSINSDYKIVYENAINEGNMIDVYANYDLVAYIDL